VTTGFQGKKRPTVHQDGGLLPKRAEAQRSLYIHAASNRNQAKMMVKIGLIGAGSATGSETFSEIRVLPLRHRSGAAFNRG
jgi:hypothetical protein